MQLSLRVNGREVSLQVEPDVPLLYVLRNDLGLNGPKFGCGLAQCGACTVLVNGEPVRSCVRPIGRLVGREVTTLEGLGTRETPHPLQEAFLEEQAFQCGYCANGILMTAAALLAQNSSPSEGAIRRALDGNLCRCGAHPRILKAVQRAAQKGGSG